MKAIGVIPARWGATRFEGKVLANLLGKPVIQHVWENARRAKTLDDLIVACDDERILQVVQGFGGKAVYTSVDQPSGTDRLAEVINPLDVTIAVNIQGDEPLVKPIMIDSLVMALQDEKTAQMATVIKRVEDEAELTNSNVVKVVIDKTGALTYTVKGVKGAGCKALTKAIDALGTVTESKNTSEFCELPAVQQQKTGR